MTQPPSPECKDKTIVMMSYIAQISAYIFCAFLVFHAPDMTNATVATLVGTILGFVISEAKNYSAYWTNTTKSSEDKSVTIAAMKTQPANATTTTITSAAPTTVSTETKAEKTNEKTSTVTSDSGNSGL